MGEISVDFVGLEPAQGSGSSFVHIPRGFYLLKLEKVEPRVTNAGQKAVRINVSVARGEKEGTPMQDEFLLDPSATGSRFGAQRFMAFLVACGVPVQATSFKFESATLVNKIVVGDVQDNEMKESTERKPDGTAKYPARTISRPVAYYNPRALPTEVAEKMGIKPAAPAATAPAAAVATPVAVAPAPVLEPVAVSAPTVNGTGEVASLDVTQVAQDVEDLFK